VLCPPKKFTRMEALILEKMTISGIPTWTIFVTHHPTEGYVCRHQKLPSLSPTAKRKERRT
jgi:hypothetical protein